MQVRNRFLVILGLVLMSSLLIGPALAHELVETDNKPPANFIKLR